MTGTDGQRQGDEVNHLWPLPSASGCEEKEDFRMYEGVLVGSAGWPVHPAILTIASPPSAGRSAGNTFVEEC
jgi:hypothetical protein